MSEKVHLIIAMEGGLIQAIVSNKPKFFNDIEITVVDYDVDGHDDYLVIAQGKDGLGQADAFVNSWSVELAELPIPIQIIDDDEE